MNLLLGSSGYLGTNLLEYLAPHQTITVSRDNNAPDVLAHIHLDFREQLAPDELQAILHYRPSHIYVLGRPVENDFFINKRFYDNLKSLFLQLANDPVFSCVHFFSTTLVYDGIAHVSSSKLGEVKPYSFYEYFKLDFELFLQYLSIDLRPDLAIYVHRLPILFGGKFSSQKNLNQFLYQFLHSYAQGIGWNFETDADKQYGTSWAFTPDLCKVITSITPKSGFHLRNVASGFFTYFQLHDILSSHLGCPVKNDLKLYRSYFEVDDELGLPQMKIQDAILTSEWSID